MPNINIIAVKPPYYLNSNHKTGKNLMVLVPGPFSFSQLKLYSKDYIEVVKKVINKTKPPKIFIRFHPRQNDNLKSKLIDEFSELKYQHKFVIHNNSVDIIINTVPRCNFVIGATSGALRVSRLCNNSINVIGVLNSFYVNGIWEKNILLSGLEDVLWVTKASEINFSNFRKKFLLKKMSSLPSYKEILFN